MEPNSTTDREESAFVGLLTECQLPLQLYVRALMPHDPSAGDVIQQTNAKIWEKRHEFESGTNFRAWAMAIARYEVLNHRKRQARDARLQFSSELAETVASELIDLTDDLADRQVALRECLQSLPKAHSELLMQRYRSAEPLSEFAGRIGRSAGSIKVTLHRLRNSLADCIEKRLLAVEESR